MTLNHSLGAQVKLVYGYQGSKEINLAMQRGEVDGTCGISASSAGSGWAAGLKNGNLKIVTNIPDKDQVDSMTQLVAHMDAGIRRARLNKDRGWA